MEYLVSVTESSRLGFPCEYEDSDRLKLAQHSNPPFANHLVVAGTESLIALLLQTLLNILRKLAYMPYLLMLLDLSAFIM